MELGVARNVTSDELCGCRSSGEVESEDTGHGEARGVVLRVPASAVLLVAVEAEGGSKNERMGKGQKLTAEAMS